MLANCACMGDVVVDEHDQHDVPVEVGDLRLPEALREDSPVFSVGEDRYDDVRRSRAQEVRESEQNFLREFTAMMKTGLTVAMRDRGGEPDSLTPVHLMLVSTGKHAAIEWHYRDESDLPVTGHAMLGEISAVSPNPDPARLGHELSSRSFLVTMRDDALLFHADSKDICSLLVDGLQMCIKRKQRPRKIKRAALAEYNDNRTSSYNAVNV